MGPAYAANSRNERIDFQNDVDAGMYKEAIEELGADADPFEIMEWQSDYNSEQRSKAKFEDNKKRFGGTHSGLNKFVLGGFDPTMMYNVEGANRQERQKNILDQMIFNEDNLDNLTIINPKGTEKIIMLKKLGVLDYLKEKTPFNTSTNSLASVISTITGIKQSSVYPMIQTIFKPLNNQKNNPLKSKKAVSSVKQVLNSLGYIYDK